MTNSRTETTQEVDRQEPLRGMVIGMAAESDSPY